MTNFFEAYQGYILAGITQIIVGVGIAIRLNNRVRDLEKQVEELSEEVEIEKEARTTNIKEIQECMKADMEGLYKELKEMNQNISDMRECYAEFVGFFRGQGFKIRGGE